MNYESLMEKAKEASKNAYAKYSNFKVGACVLTKSGNIYTGCNVENASYGLAICAERCAIFKAISNGEKEITAVAIYSPNMQNCMPCGACRQVIYEFSNDGETDVITLNNEQLSVNKIGKLLPEGFVL